MTKRIPPEGIIKTKGQPKSKELKIDLMFGYKVIISKDAYEVHWDKSPETNLAALAITDQILNDNITMVQEFYASNPTQKKLKKERLERLRKLKLETVNCMAEIAEYLLATKEQSYYDDLRDKTFGKKSKIVKATTEDVKKIILSGK